MKQKTLNNSSIHSKKKFFYPICPSCLKPTIIECNASYIKIDCSCGYKNLISIEEYTKILIFHQNTEIMTKCPKHIHKEFKFYCTDCELHICDLCKNQKIHKSHSIVPLTLNLNIPAINKNMEDFELQLFNYVQKIKNSGIEILKNQIRQVKKEAQNCLKRNKEILNFIKEIIKGYEAINNNYYIEKNITNNVFFKVDFYAGSSIAYSDVTDIIQAFRSLSIVNDRIIYYGLTDVSKPVNIVKKEYLDIDSLIDIQLLNEDIFACFYYEGIINLHSTDTLKLIHSYEKDYDINAFEILDNLTIAISVTDEEDKNYIKFLTYNQNELTLLKSIKTGDELFEILLLFPSNRLIAISKTCIKIYRTFSPYSVVSTIRTQWEITEAHGLVESDLLVTYSNYASLFAVWDLKNFQLQTVIKVGDCEVKTFSQINNEEIVCGVNGNKWLRMNVVSGRMDENIIEKMYGEVRHMCYKNGKVLFTVKKKKPELRYDNENEETVVCRLGSFIEVNGIGLFDALRGYSNLLIERGEEIEKICFVNDNEFIAVMEKGYVKKMKFNGLESVIEI